MVFSVFLPWVGCKKLVTLENQHKKYEMRLCKKKDHHHLEKSSYTTPIIATTTKIE